MEKFVISTTPTIEGHPIKAYLGPINVNIVIGTNFFSDFAASFTDVFGGNSNTYQRKMDAMYESAKNELEKKAKRIGGNAIVGFTTDFDEISGKGKSMFMLSATGTVCKIDSLNTTPAMDSSSNYIDASILTKELDKDILMDLLNKTTSIYSIGEKNWTFMTDHPSKEALKILLDKFYIEAESDHKNKIESLIDLIDNNDASDILYEKYSSMPDGILYDENAQNCKLFADLIIKHSLFNPTATQALLASSPAKAIDILQSNKAFYTMEDLKQMKNIISMLNDLPDVGQISIGKNGVFSKEKELFICRHGHKNDKESEFCQTCGENIKGITRNHQTKIEQFKVKVETLERLLTSK